MVVAVMFSHAVKEGIEANRRHAENYYRDTCMARGPRGKCSLPETFWEPSRKFCNMTSVSGNLPRASRAAGKLDVTKQIDGANTKVLKGGLF